MKAGKSRYTYRYLIDIREEATGHGQANASKGRHSANSLEDIVEVIENNLVEVEEFITKLEAEEKPE